MLLPLIALCSFGQDQGSLDPVIRLLDKDTGKQTGFVREYADRLQTPQKSPKSFGPNSDHWIFDWETVSSETISPGTRHFTKFYVFSQDREPTNDPAVSVTRMLQRLWEYKYLTLNIDDDPNFGGGVVQVYLCQGGVPGGEQLFDFDHVNGTRPTKVNTIYLYDLPTFKDPVEMAREVAHEYGHASLVGVGGYRAPEDWANGYLGEKLYLTHIVDAMKQGKIGPDDVMGAKLDDLQKWVDLKVKPLIAKASQSGPDLSALKARDSVGMDRFIGLALYVDAILPESVMSRALALMPSTNAEDYPETVLMAAQEIPKLKLKIPDYLQGKNLWIPLGEGSVSGAILLKRSSGWAYISPKAKDVIVTQKPQ